MLRGHNNNLNVNGHINGGFSGQNGHVYNGQNGGFSVCNGPNNHSAHTSGNFSGHYLQNGHAKTNGHVNKCK